VLRCVSARQSLRKEQGLRWLVVGAKPLRISDTGRWGNEIVGAQIIPAIAR
jgi:hypothetical protein